MQFAALILIATLALVESWLQPWFAIAGVPMPITLISIVVLQTKISPKLLPWLGLIAGLIIDTTSANYFGVNSLYYLSISWLLALPLVNSNQRRSVQTKVGIIVLAAFIQPWYLQLASRQFETDLWYNWWTSIIRSISALVVSSILIWIIAKKEAKIV